MTFTASQIAALINGDIAGDATTAVNSFGKIEEAKQGQLSFFANPKYEEFLYSTSASIIIINQDFELKSPINATLIKVPDAYSAFATLLTKYEELTKENKTGIEQPSFIAPTAKIASDVYIGAFAYISEGVVIGAGTKIYPHSYIGKNVCIGSQCCIHPGVKIHDECKLGNDVIIHAGAVIGSDGFGFAPQQNGSFQKIPQLGNVVIEDDVEIGANTTIDRATIGATIIKTGAKLDNLIQIAHNAEVGKSTVIAAQAGISGSAKLGNYVQIGGQAGLVGHIQLGDGAKVNAQSGVTKSIEAGKAVTGSPANDYMAELKTLALIRQMPELLKRINELESALKKVPH